MSDLTPEQQAAETQLEEALASCAKAWPGPGELVTGWVVTATLTSGDLMDTGSTAYLRLSPTIGQAFHVSMGLLLYHLEHLRHEMFMGGETP